MPLFSRRAAEPAAPAEPTDAAGLSHALLAELRGQRQDFKQTYAMLESRLDRLEKVINHRPGREAPVAAAASAGAASSPRSPSDEETRYVLGDAESMEIIVNLGPLRTGQPLSVERRALTPAARRWWARDQDDEAPSVPTDAQHASYHAGKHATATPASATTTAAKPGTAPAGASRAPSSYHWVIGRDGALHDQRPPSPTTPPPPRTTPSAPSSPLKPVQQPVRPTIVTQAPPQEDPVSKGLLKRGTPLSQDCVVLLAPNDQRDPGVRGPGPASSVCFGLEDDDIELKTGAKTGSQAGPGRRGLLGRPLSRIPADGSARQHDRQQTGVTGEKIGIGASGSSLQTLHRSAQAQADYSSGRADTLAVPAPVRPASSVCFSLEEHERERAAGTDQSPGQTQQPGKDVPAVPRPATRPGAQYRPHAMHGPYGPHRPYGAKRSASAARLAWCRRSPPPSSWVVPPERRGRQEPQNAVGTAGTVGAVDEEGLRSCLRCVECRAGPRAPPPAPRLPVRLRIGSSRQSRLGEQLRAWDGTGGRPRCHRSPHRSPAQDDEDEAAAGSRPASRVSSWSRPPSAGSGRGAPAKSNIHLAKIYAKTDLVLVANAMVAPPSPRTRAAHHRPLRHLPTCPRYVGPVQPDAKQLVTLFESPAAGQSVRLGAAARAAREHKDYLAHLSEYVRAISKGPRPATVIRNELRVLPPSAGTSPREAAPKPRVASSPRRSRRERRDGPRGLDTTRDQIRWHAPLAIMDARDEPEQDASPTRTRNRGEPMRSAHRKHTCRDSRSQRSRNLRPVLVAAASPADAPDDAHAEAVADAADDGAKTPQESTETPPNNTLCSFICDYCSKLRQML